MRALHLSSPIGLEDSDSERNKSEEASKERRKTGKVVFLLWRCEGGHWRRRNAPRSGVLTGQR
jgi:hypothetical protein